MAMTDNELLKADKEGRVDVAAGTAGGGMMMLLSIWKRCAECATVSAANVSMKNAG